MVRNLNGICNSPDLCGKEDCKYYDTSQEATKKYVNIVLGNVLREDLPKNEVPENCPLNPNT